MIGYITLGTNDKNRAAKFYDEVLSLLDISQVGSTDRMVYWSKGQGPVLAIAVPFDGKPATHGNGTMVALTAPSPEMVDKVYNRAIELGGVDEGKPGPRGERAYSAYFRDLDGNKILVFCPVS